ncbi:MAG: hypothetical protein RL088_948 [Verrucomicrobiota bacterium]|jgi:hypothetical protein
MILRILFAMALAATTFAAPEVNVQKIWDAAPHNAFTDLARWNNTYWIVFREADAHVGGDGKIRVIRSATGDKWESAALISEEGIDLRDPKICVTPDERLMVVAGGSVYKGGTKLLGRQPRVMFSKDGAEWTAPQRVLAEGDWLWRVTWQHGTAYGVSYKTSAPEGTPEDTGEWTATLYSSEDALKWTPVSTLAVTGRPNETTLRFDMHGDCHALVRRESGDKQGWLGTAKPPFTEWKWAPIGRAIGGPNLLMPPGQTVAAGRDYLPEGPKTAIGPIVEGKWNPTLTLPSGGDSSYPGLFWNRGEWWVSYYSSHEGKSAIYLARIRGL